MKAARDTHREMARESAELSTQLSKKSKPCERGERETERGPSCPSCHGTDLLAAEPWCTFLGRCGNSI